MVDVIPTGWAKDMPIVQCDFLTGLQPRAKPPVSGLGDFFAGMGTIPRADRYTRTVLMLVHELTPAECLEVLHRSDFGRLGCAHHNQPYIVPIHFSFDAIGPCVYAFSTVGQKIKWMRENPKVCIEVEDITDKDHWTTVLAFGRYEEMGDSPADKAARATAERLFQQRPEWWLPGAAKVAAGEHHAVLVYRIQITRLTGRRASRETV
jgi:nitroimidazol reductase NimA-like FMN-containing flavoprotein (pyridoxamine 5'-phosphate oxidase superfamily)